MEKQNKQGSTPARPEMLPVQKKEEGRSMTPPAFSPEAQPVQRVGIMDTLKSGYDWVMGKLGWGEEAAQTGDKTQAQPEEKKPEAQPAKQSDAKGTTTAAPAAAGAATPQSVTLSRGLMQFITEGDFNGGDYDCRKPHFPQNIYVFQKLTEDEKKAEDAKTNKKDKIARYKGPDTIGRFSADAAGDFKILKRDDRHSEATYTQTLTADQQLGTTGGSSGVTVGFGIDIGAKWFTTDQDKVKKYFTAGGVTEDHADKLSKAAGLKGLKAAEKAATLRAQVELTDEQVIKVLKSAVNDLNKSESFTRGDGTYHPVVEEVIFYARYWGETALATTIKDGVKGKTGADQIAAARDAVKTKRDALGKDNWKYNGYNSVWALLARLADMAAAGIEIKMTDAVLEKDALLKDDASFKVVQDASELRDNYAYKGKDLKDQMTGTPLGSLISASVGTGKKAKNVEADVKAVQQLLYNGNYDLTVSGTWDDKTKAAAEKFQTDMGFKVSETIDPSGKVLRALKQFEYKTRTAK